MYISFVSIFHFRTERNCNENVIVSINPFKSHLVVISMINYKVLSK